ncbi:MAG: hypothetical protein IJH12_00830 [Clostridia bacterium]|nr:hypothetical protein [Clostridia bacterium]
MKKRIFTIFLIFFVGIIFIIFIKNNYKKIKFGNNESNKSVKDIEAYILNINSYKATVEVTVNSNKNSNKYLMSQESNIKENTSRQTIINPQNIEGVEIISKNGDIAINNSRLNLSEIYNEYPHISENILWLDSFIDKYKNAEVKSDIYEDKEYIVMEIDDKNNKYFKSRKLYLDKHTGLPKKMVAHSDDKKNEIYIIYNEIIINE